MASAAVFIGWGAAVVGRERQALQLFDASVEYWARLQQARVLASYEALLLEPHGGDLAQGIHDYLAPWRGQAYTDYSTHCIYSNRTPPDAIARFHELVEAGFPSVKIFTTDITPSRRWRPGAG